MNIDWFWFCVGGFIGSVMVQTINTLVARRARRRRAKFAALPTPDTLVYRNAQSVADWHRKRIEQRISE